MIIVTHRNSDIDECIGVADDWYEAYGRMFSDMVEYLTDDKQKLCIEALESNDCYEQYKAYLDEKPEDVMTYMLYYFKKE